MMFRKATKNGSFSSWEHLNSDISNFSTDELDFIWKWAVINMALGNSKTLLYDYGSGEIFHPADAESLDMEKAEKYYQEYTSRKYHWPVGLDKRTLGMISDIKLHAFTPAVLERAAKRHLGDAFEFKFSVQPDLCDSDHQDLVIPFSIPWYNDIRTQLYSALRSYPIEVPITHNTMIYIGSISREVIETHVMPIGWENELNTWVFSNVKFVDTLLPWLTYPKLIASTAGNELITFTAKPSDPYHQYTATTIPVIPRYYVKSVMSLDDPFEYISNAKNNILVCLGLLFRHMSSTWRVNTPRGNNCLNPFVELNITPTLLENGASSPVKVYNPSITINFSNGHITSDLDKISLEHRMLMNY